MSFVKLFLFLVVCFVFLCGAVVLRLFLFLFRIQTSHSITICTQLWSKVLLHIFGIHVHTISEQQTPFPTALIISNHQSYLDIIIIASLFPTLFVAKKEVQQWPILGWLAMLGRTVFVDRNSFRGTSEAVNEVETALQLHNNVLVFPEGTSTTGVRVLPFYSSFFNAPIHTSSAVLPISIVYKRINNSTINKKNNSIVCWYGSMTFVDHFWNVLQQKSIDVEVIVHLYENCQPLDDAKVIAKKFHTIVEQPLYTDLPLISVPTFSPGDISV